MSLLLHIRGTYLRAPETTIKEYFDLVFTTFVGLVWFFWLLRDSVQQQQQEIARLKSKWCEIAENSQRTYEYISFSDVCFFGE